jgi:uncharacterized protein
MAETTLITGTSSGIGLELARLFAADRSDLILVARSEEKLERLAAELREQHGVQVRVLAKDLGDPASASKNIQAIYDTLAAENVTVDVLVNNAGFGLCGEFDALPLERQLEMVELNVTTLTHLSRLFLPGMIARRSGGILNVASTASFQSGPFLAVYYATKAYVLSFSEALAEELAGRGVRVTCLCPGPTATEFASVANVKSKLLFRMGLADARSVAAAGYRAFRRGKTLIVPGMLNKFGTLAVRFTPRMFVRKFVRTLQE